MANKDFEVHQLLKAYRKGLVSEEFFTQQMDEMCGSRKSGMRHKDAPAGRNFGG